MIRRVSRCPQNLKVHAAKCNRFFSCRNAVIRIYKHIGIVFKCMNLAFRNHVIISFQHRTACANGCFPDRKCQRNLILLLQKSVVHRMIRMHMGSQYSDRTDPICFQRAPDAVTLRQIPGIYQDTMARVCPIQWNQLPVFQIPGISLCLSEFHFHRPFFLIFCV